MTTFTFRDVVDGEPAKHELTEKELSAQVAAATGPVVEVVDVATRPPAGLVLVYLRLPEMPERERLCLQEATYTALAELDVSDADGSRLTVAAVFIEPTPSRAD